MTNNFRRMTFTAIACCLTVLIYSQQTKKPVAQRMNIVFLLADDLRWNSLHCTGTDFLVTPNIDKLAANGVLFNNACVTTPICCVSRASLLTGQFMSRHGVDRFSKQIPEDKFGDTYPATLRAAGYYTGFVGKYGVGKIRAEDFDFSSEYEGKHWYPVDANGKVGAMPVKGTITGDSIHVTDRNANDAIAFLRSRPKDKPFDLSVSFFAPHAEDNHPDQYRYKPSSEKYYSDITIPVPETSTPAAFQALPPFIANEKNFGRVRWHWRFDTPEKYQRYMKAYYRLVTDVDVAVGKIIEELKAEGVYNNTLIVFMGDNGYFQSDHQLADKWYAYEESIRVPLIIYDPRLPAKARGTINKEFALNIDIAPTLIASAGIQVPDSIQGKDLSPLYLGKRKPVWRQDFFVEHPVIISTDRIPASEALVTHSEKYIIYPYYNYQQYFNLKKDSKEEHDGYNDPANQKNITALKRRFMKLKAMAK